MTHRSNPSLRSRPRVQLPRSVGRSRRRSTVFKVGRAVVYVDKSPTVASLVGTKRRDDCHWSRGWHSRGSCGRRIQSAVNERSLRHERGGVFVLATTKDDRDKWTGFCQRSDRSYEIYWPFRFQPLACVYLPRVTMTICLRPKLNGTFSPRSAPVAIQVTLLSS